MTAAAMEALLGSVPVWLMITPLIGVVNGAVFFLLVGRRPRSLLIYVVLACLATSGVQALGLVEGGAPPLSLGDIQLVLVSAAAWVALAAARALGW